MAALISLLHLASGLLVVAGTAKLIAPSGTAEALRSAGLPGRTTAVRGLGVAEVAIGTATIIGGGWIGPAAVAVVYGGFTGFVAVRLRSGDAGGCGCFGRTATPLTRLHLGVDAVAALSAILFVLDPAPGLVAVLAEQPWAGVPYLLVITLGVALAVALLTVLPATRSAGRAPVARPLSFGPVPR